MVIKFGMEAFPNKHGIKLSKFKNKVRNNMSYPILIMEVDLLPIESKALR